MATKTSTSGLEAYGRLTAARSGSESFSQVIRRIVPRPLDMQRFHRELHKAKLSDKAASAIEEQIAQRSRPSRRRR